jgi:hypothetical protein
LGRLESDSRLRVTLLKGGFEHPGRTAAEIEFADAASMPATAKRLGASRQTRDWVDGPCHDKAT